MVLTTEPGEAGACALENICRIVVAVDCSGGTLLARQPLVEKLWPPFSRLGDITVVSARLEDIVHRVRM
jgi:hypothetical protein